jgi:tetratricopeptide (TPR) repeat protein
MVALLLLAAAGCSTVEPAPRPGPAAPAPAAPAPPAAPTYGPVAAAPADGLSEESERLLEHAAMILEALDAGSYALAAQETQRLSASFPGSGDAWLIQILLERRLAQLKSGDAVAASASLTAKRHEMQARSLIKQGRNEDARLLLERAHALDPANSEVAESLVSLLKQMGLERYGVGDPVQATALWRRALEIRPDDAETQRFLKRADAVKEKS